MSTITVRLPAKLKKELDGVIRIEKVSKSDLIREALDRFLSTRKFRQLRNKVLPFAEAQGLLTDDDIFKALQK